MSLLCWSCWLTSLDLIPVSVMVSQKLGWKMPELAFFSFHVSWCCRVFLMFQVILNVILNLFGVLFAIAAIVLYSIDIALGDLWWLCDYDYRFEYQTPSPAEERLEEKCLQGKELLLVSLISDKTTTTCRLHNCIRALTISRALRLCLSWSRTCHPGTNGGDSKSKIP